jgi:hypothetical protein
MYNEYHFLQFYKIIILTRQVIISVIFGRLFDSKGGEEKINKNK